MVTLLVSVPIDSIVTLTSSPAVSGPTPSGVPVSSTSPGSRVITDDTYSISDGTSHSSSLVRAGVAEDDLRRPLLRHLPAEPADDHRELALVIHPVGQLDRVRDPVAVA